MKQRNNTAKLILRNELKRVALLGFGELLQKVQDSPRQKYEVSTDNGVYQIDLQFSEAQNSNVINVLGSIDGPGVFHLLGIVFSVTDFFSIDNLNKVTFK